MDPVLSALLVFSLCILSLGLGGITLYLAHVADVLKGLQEEVKMLKGTAKQIAIIDGRSEVNYRNANTRIDQIFNELQRRPRTEF